VMTVAKALSSAYLPIGAALLPEEMFEAMVEESRKLGTFGHGNTYSGHPVCAAVALKTLEIMERRDILAHVRRLAPHFQARLKALGDHPLVGEARGVGLIGGLELVADKNSKRPFDPAAHVAAHCMAQAFERGLIVRAIGDTIALCPPLIITADEVDELYARLEAAMDATQAWIGREHTE